MTLISHLGSHTQHAASPILRPKRTNQWPKLKWRFVIHSSSFLLQTLQPMFNKSQHMLYDLPYTLQHQNTPVHKTSSHENKVNHGEQLMSYSLYVKYADAGYIYIFLKKRSFNLKGSKTWPLLEIVKTIIGT